MVEPLIVSYVDLQNLGIKYCPTHLNRLEEDNDFPLSFHLTDDPKSKRVWWYKEIVQWLKDRAAKGRPTGPGPKRKPKK